MSCILQILLSDVTQSTFSNEIHVLLRMRCTLLIFVLVNFDSLFQFCSHKPYGILQYTACTCASIHAKAKFASCNPYATGLLIVLPVSEFIHTFQNADYTSRGERRSGYSGAQPVVCLTFTNQNHPTSTGISRGACFDT